MQYGINNKGKKEKMYQCPNCLDYIFFSDTNHKCENMLNRGSALD